MAAACLHWRRGDFAQQCAAGDGSCFSPAGAAASRVAAAVAAKARRLGGQRRRQSVGVGVGGKGRPVNGVESTANGTGAEEAATAAPRVLVVTDAGAAERWELTEALAANGLIGVVEGGGELAVAAADRSIDSLAVAVEVEALPAQLGGAPSAPYPGAGVAGPRLLPRAFRDQLACSEAGLAVLNRHSTFSQVIRLLRVARLPPSGTQDDVWL